MPLFLSERNTVSREHMDDHDCDSQKLINTYRQFSTINSMLSGWKKIYKKHLRPALFNSSCSLLDIGFGGGDIPLKLAHWAAEDGLNLRITAIEQDTRAIDFAASRKTPSNVSFKYLSSGELVKSGASFDFVISNHLLHHLSEPELHQLLTEAKQLCTKKVIFNDLERSDLGYTLFNIISRPLFVNSFITQDGLTSIRRSYTRDELERIIPQDWQVQPLFPFRLLLQYPAPAYDR